MLVYYTDPANGGCKLLGADVTNAGVGFEQGIETCGGRDWGGLTNDEA